MFCVTRHRPPFFAADPIEAQLTGSDLSVVPGSSRATVRFGLGSLALAAILSAGLGAAASLVETRYSVFQITPARAVWPLVAGVLSIGVAAWLPQTWSLPDLRPAAVIAASFVVSLLLGWLAGVGWPNSGDEYRLRLPRGHAARRALVESGAPVPPLFETWHIPTVGQETFAYYAPGWPAIIALFRPFALERLISPLMTALMAFALWRSLRLLRVPPELHGLGLAAIIFSPFVLLNGGSLYPHAASGGVVGVIIWTRLSAELRPSWLKEACIGALFSVMLTMRYDAFAVVLVVYVTERLWRRRTAVVSEFAIAGLGAVPLLLLWLLYNHGITGSWLTPPYTWANHNYHMGLWGFGEDGQHSPGRAAQHVAVWTGELAEYAGFALVPLYALALVAKWRRRDIRFYDLLLPAVVVFYCLHPDNGGFRYGPRYWFYGWIPVILTILSGLDQEWRERFGRFALVNLAFCAGALPVLTLVCRLNIDIRREIYATQRPPRLQRARPQPRLRPVPVAIPDEPRLSRRLHAQRPRREGPSALRGWRLPNAVELACQLGGRHVYSGRRAENTWSSPAA